MTIIIGAGPAGLAMAGQLTHLQKPFVLLEAGEHVGLAWRNHYDRLALHTVKQHSDLPHWPMPADFPLYVPRLQLVEYYERYIAHFNIQPRFNQPARRVVRQEDGRWRVETPTDVFVGDDVVVCTGYSRVPNAPDLPGLRDFRGVVLHSRDYRNGAAFRGERVLVVGMGNTGAEIALDLLEHGATPFISVRGPVSIVRREAFGRPAQPAAIFLSQFPNWFYDLASGFSQRMSVGDLSAYGLGRSKNPPSRDIRNGKIPVIDLGTLEHIKSDEIRALPGIRQINTRSVTFTDGREEAFDAIVLATGYRPALASLLGDELAAGVLNERGYPHGLWPSEPFLQGLYFLGFATPISGILRGIKLDSGQIAARMRAKTFSPAA
jgi:cation diffusion facilitator CzcD-associated flavoprotein CzcO